MVWGHSSTCYAPSTERARGWRCTMLGLAVALGAIGFVGPVPAFGADRPALLAEGGNPRFEHHAPRAASIRASLPSAQLTPNTLSACNSSWNIVASPSPGGISEFNGVAAITANDVWTVGDYSTATNIFLTFSEHWDGSSWTNVPTPNAISTGENFLTSVAAIAKNDVWAVGFSRPDPNSARSTLVEHWNGSSWSIVASPNVSPGTNSLFAVRGDTSSDVWAVGRTKTSTTSATVLVEHWNGVSWTISSGTQNPSSFSELNALTVLSPTNVWAVGDQTTDAVHYQTLVEHFDGTTWSTSPSTNAANGNGFLLGVSGSTNDLWAVGATTLNPATSSATNATLVEHWNGSSWSTVAAPTGSDTDLEGIAALSPSNVWAVGANFGTSTTPDQTFVLHWDGATWSTVASPNVAGASSDLFDIAAVSASDIWAVGTAPVTSTSWQTLSENFCAPPAVTSITPTGGSPSGSTPVTITGTGLVWASGVNFGTSPASSFTINSDSQVTAVSPSGTGTVDVRVAYFAGLSAITPTDQFTYIVTAPVAPTNVVAIAGVGSATVYWTAPLSDGGAPITSYTIPPYDVNQIAQVSTPVTGSPPPTKAVVSGLTNGSAYTFKVTATNSVGGVEPGDTRTGCFPFAGACPHPRHPARSGPWGLDRGNTAGSAGHYHRADHGPGHHTHDWGLGGDFERHRHQHHRAQLPDYLPSRRAKALGIQPQLGGRQYGAKPGGGCCGCRRTGDGL